MLVEGELCGGSEFEPHWSSSCTQLVCVWWVLTYNSVEFPRGAGWLAGKKMCWVSTFSFRDSEKALAFSSSPYDPKGVDRAENEAKRCEIQFNFQKYTSRNDSTNNYRVIKEIVLPLDVWELAELTYRFSLSSHHLNPRHRRFVVFSLMVKSGFELGAPRWHSTALSTEPLEPPTPLTKRCVSTLAPLLILKTYFNFALNSWPIFKFGPMFVCFVFWVIRTDTHTPKTTT